MIGAEAGLWAKSGILKKNIFFQKISTPVPRLPPELRECVTSMIFKGYFFFAWWAWQDSPQLKISLWFFLFLTNLFFWNIMVTCDEKEKILYSQNVLLWIFLKKKIFNLKVCSIKPFISGFGPNHIEHRAPTGRSHCLLQPNSCGYTFLKA